MQSKQDGGKSEREGVGGAELYFDGNQEASGASRKGRVWGEGNVL